MDAIERWRVCDLVVDFGARIATRAGAVVALPPLSFRFLRALILAWPNALSIDDLMTLVWSGVVVNDETVTQRAKLVRDALGDDPRHPRYFAVLRGVGYRLAEAPIRLTGSEPEHPAPISSTRKPARLFWWAVLGALVLSVGVGGTAFMLRPQHRQAIAAVRVAVLPFEDLSADPADAFIAQSIPEMVLNRLSTVPGLMVIAHNSSVLAAADSSGYAKLGAAYVVRGSVQRTGGLLRVTCFLVDTASDERLWSEQFDWPVDRLYALQDHIADRVAASLEARTGEAGKLPPVIVITRNTDAYLAYLKGKSLLGRFTVAETDAAAAQFERAVTLDPDFAAALVALYDARMQAADLRKNDLGPIRAQYGQLLDRALRIQPDSGEAQFAKAMWSDAPEGERTDLFRQAALHDPSNSRGLTAFAEFLEWKARFSEGGLGPEGQRLMDRVLTIDPLSPRARFWKVMRQIGKIPPDQLEQQQRQELELDPNNYPLANRYATRLWMFHGETAGAIESMERTIATDPQNPWGPHVAVALYLDADDPAAARAIAAATPATRDSSKVVLDVYAADWRGAGEAALGPRGFLFNQFTNYLWPEAIRDYALKTGEYDRAAKAIAARFDFDLSRPQVTYLAQIVAAPALAHILLAKGDRERANRLLTQTVSWLDAHYARYGPSGYLRYRATAVMLLGDKDRALNDLASSITSAHDIRHWWYEIDRDPVWAPVRSDPRFLRLAEQCRGAAAQQRAKLDAARRAGKVPSRAPAPRT